MEEYQKPRKKKDKAKEKGPYSSKHVRQLEKKFEAGQKRK
jgi:hypothetical protein